MEAEWRTLAGRIKWARKRKKITQSSIARVFKITRNAVSQWEKEAGTVPEPEKMAELARTLGVNVVWLWEGKGQPDGEITVEEARALALFRGLPLDRQSIVLQLLTSMADDTAPDPKGVPPHVIPKQRQ